MFFSFSRIRNGVREWGITSGDSSEQAMQHVLGSHPEEYGVTYANVYIPDSELYCEWFMHPPRNPQDHKPMR